MSGPGPAPTRTTKFGGISAILNMAAGGCEMEKHSRLMFGCDGMSADPMGLRDSAGAIPKQSGLSLDSVSWRWCPLLPNLHASLQAECRKSPPSSDLHPYPTPKFTEFVFFGQDSCQEPPNQKICSSFRKCLHTKSIG